MYKLFDKIERIRWYVLADSKCLVNDLHRVWDLGQKKEIYWSEIKLQEVRFGDKFFINDLYAKGIYFNDNLKPVKTDYFIQFFENDYVSYIRRESDEKNTYIENLVTGELYKLESSSLIVFQHEGMYWRKNFKNNSIETFKFPTIESLWKYDINQFGEYKKLYSPEMKIYELSNFLGVWQEELLVSCQGGLILSLNIHSGELIRKWDKLPESADDNIKEVFRGGLQQSGHVYQFNEAGSKIIAIYYHHILEIDLVTGEIDVKNLFEYLQQHNMSNFQLKSGYAEDETHYFTTVDFDRDKLGLNYMPTGLCAINKISLEIDWFYRFDEDGSGDYVSVQVPQIGNGKLYQLTSNGNLHIFEKE